MSRPEQLDRRTNRKMLSARLTLLAAATAVAVGAIGAGLWHEARNPRFAVRLVAVTGLEHTTYQDVVVAAGLDDGQNAWLVNRAAVEQRIEALPWVGRAGLRVAWPNRLSIRIVERTPRARVALRPSDGEEPMPRYAIVDASQRALEVTQDPSRFAQLPVLVVLPPPTAVPGETIGRPEVGQALDAYQRLSDLGLRVSEVAIAPSTGISATADRNLRVLFGDDEDLARKAQIFQAIVAKISTPSRIAYVDVRSVRAPTVLYR